MKEIFNLIFSDTFAKWFSMLAALTCFMTKELQGAIFFMLMAIFWQMEEEEEGEEDEG
jgi:hypothetical protein